MWRKVSLCNNNNYNNNNNNNNNNINTNNINNEYEAISITTPDLNIPTPISAPKHPLYKNQSNQIYSNLLNKMNSNMKQNKVFDATNGSF